MLSFSRRGRPPNSRDPIENRPNSASLLAPAVALAKYLSQTSLKDHPALSWTPRNYYADLCRVHVARNDIRVSVLNLNWTHHVHAIARAYLSTSWHENCASRAGTLDTCAPSLSLSSPKQRVQLALAGVFSPDFFFLFKQLTVPLVDSAERDRWWFSPVTFPLAPFWPTHFVTMDGDCGLRLRDIRRKRVYQFVHDADKKNEWSMLGEYTYTVTLAKRFTRFRFSANGLKRSHLRILSSVNA